MDGTLIDSMPYWKNLATDYLKSQNIFCDMNEINLKIKSMTMSQSSAYFVNRFGMNKSQITVENELNAMIEKYYIEDILLKPCVKEYLKILKSIGVKMCVASATANWLIKACLSRLEILDYFEFTISCEDINKDKTQPDIFLESAKLLGAKAKDIAVYEDALYAVKTAKSAGFYVVGIFDNTENNKWKQIEQFSDEIIIDFCNQIKEEKWEQV